MPYSLDLLDEEQKKKQQDAASTGSAPAMTGGGQSFGSGAPQTQGPGAAKGTNQQGSGFVNLDKYLAANKSNNFGQQFTGNVQGTVNAGKDALTQGAQQFTDASNQGATHWGDVQGQAQGIVAGAGDSTTQADKDKIKSLQSVQYQGPDSFLGTSEGSKAAGASAKAQQEAKAFQSEGGRFALLDQYYGRPKYSTGEKTLDNALVQSTPGVAARAQNIGTQANQLVANGAKTSQDLGNVAAANRADTQATATNTRDLVGSALKGFGTDLESRYGDWKTGAAANHDTLASDISDDDLDENSLGAYGLTSGQNLYDIDLSKYLGNPAQASLGQFASDQDYAKYKALGELAGEDGTLLDQSNRGQAGSAGSGSSSVDKDRLRTDLGARETAYKQEGLDIQSQIQQLMVQADANNKLGLDPLYKKSAEAVKEQLDAQIAALQHQAQALPDKYRSDRVVNPRTPMPIGGGPRRIR